MSILQDIFRDHFEEMEYILHPRKSVMENVEKMINCGDPAFGHALYGCTNCGHLHFVPLDVTVVFVQLVEICIQSNELFQCPPNL